MSNPDNMPPEQALWAYSSMLYDSRQERDSLRRELNIIIQQLTDLQADYQRLAQVMAEVTGDQVVAENERDNWRRIAKCFAHFKICQSEKCAIYNLAMREYESFMQDVYDNLKNCDNV